MAERISRRAALRGAAVAALGAVAAAKIAPRAEAATIHTVVDLTPYPFPSVEANTMPGLTGVRMAELEAVLSVDASEFDAAMTEVDTLLTQLTAHQLEWAALVDAMIASAHDFESSMAAVAKTLSFDDTTDPLSPLMGEPVTVDNDDGTYTHTWEWSHETSGTWTGVIEIEA